MKRFIPFIAALFCLAALFEAPCAAQGTVTTRKVRLSDFPEKTTRVVLSGSELFNNALKEQISASWRLSPYEFCTFEEYEKGKEVPGCYYLVAASAASGREADPGIIVLCLEKSGSKGDEDPMKTGFEVVNLPCAASDSPSGREFAFLPAFITIIQRYVEEAMTSDVVSYAGLSGNPTLLLKDKDLKVVFSEDDLASPKVWDPSYEDKNMVLMDEDEADELFTQAAENTVVSYVVAPSKPEKGAVCYKMLIRADTYELCYFGKHNIRGGFPAGFAVKDLKAISLTRK